MTKRVKRFHRDINFPDWTQNSLEEYLQEISQNGYITFSAHAVEGVVEYTQEYGRNLLRFILRSVKRNSLNLLDVFEFYATDMKVKKACFRCSSEKIPVDVVLVISRDATVITVYVANKGDNHATLDRNLYEH